MILSASMQHQWLSWFSVAGASWSNVLCKARYTWYTPDDTIRHGRTFPHCLHQDIILLSLHFSPIRWHPRSLLTTQHNITPQVVCQQQLRHPPWSLPLPFPASALFVLQIFPRRNVRVTRNEGQLPNPRWVLTMHVTQTKRTSCHHSISFYSFHIPWLDISIQASNHAITTTNNNSNYYNVRLISPCLTGIQEGARVMRQGQVLAIPTETVYALCTCANEDGNGLECCKCFWLSPPHIGTIRWL